MVGFWRSVLGFWRKKPKTESGPQKAEAAEPTVIPPKDEDPLKEWLTLEEYQDRTLTDAEKHQLALDRYWGRKPWHRQKTNEELGRDYERYIGYVYEDDGFTVDYTGILKGAQDSGRDLIARKYRQVYLIQCKYWEQDKLIHVNVVDQLHGSVERYRKEHPQDSVKGVLCTSARLSDEARAAAQQFGIEVKERVPLKHYPSIKCLVRIDRHTKEVTRIYHLPFHSAYDKIRMRYEEGDRTLWTAREAFDKGFRGAYR